VVALWGWYRRSWATAWLLPLALGGTAALDWVLIGRSASLSWLQAWVAAGAGGAVDAALVGYLEANRGQASYLVAVTSSMQAAPIILSTGGDPVMAIGGL